MDDLELIKKYVEDNEIERPSDLVVKQVANKSRTKVQIIQSIDRKMPLEDIQRTNNLTWDELLEELDIIVSSGTKLDIKYCLETVDESIQEDIYAHFMNASSDSFLDAYHALKDDDITTEEIQLVRIKFLSDVANWAVSGQLSELSLQRPDSLITAHRSPLNPLKGTLKARNP